MKVVRILIVGTTVMAMVAPVYMWGNADGRSGKTRWPSMRRSTASPVNALDELDVYYPGTESLAPLVLINLAE